MLFYILIIYVILWTPCIVYIVYILYKHCKLSHTGTRHRAYSGLPFRTTTTCKFVKYSVILNSTVTNLGCPLPFSSFYSVSIWCRTQVSYVVPGRRCFVFTRNNTGLITTLECHFWPSRSCTSYFTQNVYVTAMKREVCECKTTRYSQRTYQQKNSRDISIVFRNEALVIVLSCCLWQLFTLSFGLR